MSQPFDAESSHGPASKMWVPRQHGAWAMLALPFLVGISASRFDGWQLVLAGAAVSGYLASATAQIWRRAYNRARYRLPLLVYGGAFAVLGLVLAASHPPLLLTLLVLLPAAAIAVLLSQPGHPRSVGEGLAQAAQALVLVPATAYLAGPLIESRVVFSTLVAGLYLTGTVLVVRSVIRERGNVRFVALSVGYHVTAAICAALLLPAPYAILFVVLACRAIALPLVERRLAHTGRPLRPVNVGLVEMLASACLVGLCLAAPL
jgi:hypothetical protein